jgi:hypothetical protein
LAIVQTIPHPVIPSSARDLLFPVADCDISVSLNKSLRQIANPSCNVHVENHVQALTKAPIFLPRSAGVPAGYATFFELEPPIRLLFPIACTLFKTRLSQPTYSQSLAHSLKNNGGYGVGRFTNAFPFWERHLIAIAAIVSQIAGLSPRSWRDCARPTHRRPRMAANLIRRSRQRAGRLIQLSLAIKKQSVPNLPPIAGNERKANNVYKVFRKTVMSFRRIER